MMTKVKLEAEFEKLSHGDSLNLWDWVLERDWAAWDRQIEKDAASDKLDELFKKAEADHRSGKSVEP